jgi:rRNA small subunit pseudouridine methyltransferase Nep1
MATADDLEGRKPAKIPKTLVERDRTKRLIIVLENSSLESAKLGKDFELLRCDKHKHFLEKHGRDPASFRPDITHQVCVYTDWINTYNFFFLQFMN